MLIITLISTLVSTLTDILYNVAAAAAELTETFLGRRRAELHQVLQVRLLRGDLEVADVTVSLWQKVSVTRRSKQARFFGIKPSFQVSNSRINLKIRD